MFAVNKSILQNCCYVTWSKNSLLLSTTSWWTRVTIFLPLVDKEISRCWPKFSNLNSLLKNTCKESCLLVFVNPMEKTSNLFDWFYIGYTHHSFVWKYALNTKTLSKSQTLIPSKKSQSVLLNRKKIFPAKQNKLLVCKNFLLRSMNKLIWLDSSDWQCNSLYDWTD